MNSNKQLTKSEFGTKVAEFLDIAYKDYLAARILLNSHLPVQGAVLASTAIEKYFKAILSFNGNESRGHLKKSHFNAVKNFDSKLWGALNKEFLDLLQKVYALRYLDDLEQNFNLVIASREFLAELDYTAITIHKKFKLKKGQKDIVTIFDEHLAEKDSRLSLNNHVLSGMDKQEFIVLETQLVYEVRKFPFRGLIEVNYVTAPLPSDGKFMRTGLTPEESGSMQY